MIKKIQQIESRIIELVGSDLDEFKYDELSKVEREEVEGLLRKRRDITDHKRYSNPDLLRLNDFWVEVNF